MENSGRFDDKRFLVLGATGAIGAAVARNLNAAGASLCLSARRSERLKTLAGELDANVLAADLAEDDSIQQLAEESPSLDGLVYAAGISELAPVKFLKRASLDRSFQLNSIAPLLLTQQLLKHKKFREGASLVWISSVSAGKGTAGYTAYAASKSALEAAMRCVALELAGRKIRVNCLVPGMIDSAMADDAAGRISSESMDSHLERYPLGAGSAEDVAAAAQFLLSGAARWITGALIPVDGGYSIR